MSMRLLFFVLCAVGCGGRSLSKTEDTPSLCADGSDNDSDGFTDCDDQDCAVFGICAGGDSDSDTDSDSDGDTDMDSDTDTNSDSDTGPAPCPDGLDWVVETVEVRDDSGVAPSLVVDASGFAHVTYSDLVWGRIRYATNASGAWGVETAIDSSGDLSDLAIDADGFAHIAYAATHEGEIGLDYTTNASGEWVSEIVDDEAWSGITSSIQMSDSGTLHVVYLLSPPFGGYVLRHATNAGDGWDIEDIGPGECGGRSDLVLDDAENLHVLKAGGGCGGATRYWTNESGAWVSEIVGDVSAVVSLAIIDDVHVDTLNGYPNGNPLYGTRDEGGWTYEVLPIDAYWFGRLQLDDAGIEHFSYSGPGDPGEIRWMSADGGEWTWEVVDPDGGIEMTNERGPDGLGHIIWTDAATNDVQYARQCP